MPRLTFAAGPLIVIGGLRGRGLSESEWGRCHRRFREHCIKRHGLDPEDTERVAWLDLEALTLTLLAD